MSDFDKTLNELLSAEDEAFLAENLKEKDFYGEVWGSLRGPGKGMYILTWIGIIAFGIGLIFCIWKLFQVQTTREMILFGTFAIMLNSAQIALKLWFNMRINRQAIVTDIKRLQLAVSRMAAE